MGLELAKNGEASYGGGKADGYQEDNYQIKEGSGDVKKRLIDRTGSRRR